MSENIEVRLRQQITSDLDKKKAERDELDQQIQALTDKLVKFDEIFGTGGTTAAPVKTAKKTAKKGSKKDTSVSEPVSVSASSEATSTESTPNLAAQGRRDVASGKRPKIKDAMTIVMGDTPMNAESIFAGLEARGWTPNSKNPKSYISYLLSSLRDHFEKVPGQRGIYRVKPVSAKSEETVEEKTEASEAVEEASVEAQSASEPTTDSTPAAGDTEQDETDRLLADVGLGDLVVKSSTTSSASAN